MGITRHPYLDLPIRTKAQAEADIAAERGSHLAIQSLFDEILSAAIPRPASPTDRSES